MGGVDWNQMNKWLVIVHKVTTHMGGVDWNLRQMNQELLIQKSPPTWVVWIEILVGLGGSVAAEPVTTYTGGVDWNYWLQLYI